MNSGGQTLDSNEDNNKSNRSTSEAKKKRTRLTKDSDGSEEPTPKSDTNGMATTVGVSRAGEDSGESEVENGD